MGSEFPGLDKSRGPIPFVWAFARRAPRQKEFPRVTQTVAAPKRG
nr:MAG TPA: hypothetical protein [Caudoviricetes sp.]